MVLILILSRCGDTFTISSAHKRAMPSKRRSRSGWLGFWRNTSLTSRASASQSVLSLSGTATSNGYTGMEARVPSIIQLGPDQEEALARPRRLIEAMTSSEAEVARLASAGLSSKEVAVKLGKRPKTVERHIESITRKARCVYGPRVTFRGLIAAELYCFYFLMTP